jgi:hypothetical protein
MLVWRLNMAWKSGHPNQCLRLGDDAKTNRTLRARFRESASYSSPLSARAKTMLSLCTLPYASFDALVADATINSPRARVELSHGSHSGLLLRGDQIQRGSASYKRLQASTISNSGVHIQSRTSGMSSKCSRVQP